MATLSSKKSKAIKETSPIVTFAPLPATDLQSRIAARAYEIFLARNGFPGDATSDWLMAEHEICSAIEPIVPYTDNVVPIKPAAAKRKRTTSTKSITQSSSTPKASSSTRTRRPKQTKD